VTVVQRTGAGVLAKQAGLAEGGMVLVRPDGFIGFRRASVDDVAMKSLDVHLSTYLQPNFAAADKFGAGGR
jgi:ethanolamine utilization microcompartment shell protein EutL